VLVLPGNQGVITSACPESRFGFPETPFFESNCFRCASNQKQQTQAKQPKGNKKQGDKKETWQL